MVQRDHHSTWLETIWHLPSMSLLRTSPFGLRLGMWSWTKSTTSLEQGTIATARMMAYNPCRVPNRHTHTPAHILWRQPQVYGPHRVPQRGLHLALAMAVRSTYTIPQESSLIACSFDSDPCLSTSSTLAPGFCWLWSPLLGNILACKTGSLRSWTTSFFLL